MPEQKEKRNLTKSKIIYYMLNHSVTSKAELAKELNLRFVDTDTFCFSATSRFVFPIFCNDAFGNQFIYVCKNSWHT
jgi:predicted transcriptional regulator